MALWNRILFPVTNIWDHGDAGIGEQKGGNPTSAGGGLRPEPIDPRQNSQTQYLRSLTNLLGAEGENLLKSGTTTYAQGKALFDEPQRYYSNILSGDRDAALTAVGPEVRSVLAQYDGARRAVGEFGGRGGGRSSGMAELEFKKAGDISSLLQKARPDAAAKLTDLARILSALGISQEGAGLQGTGTALRGVLGKAGQDIEENANVQKMLANLGEGIGSLLAGGFGKKGG